MSKEPPHPVASSLDGVLSTILARINGEVDNGQVEGVVETLLRSQFAEKQDRGRPRLGSRNGGDHYDDSRNKHSIVQTDEDDYDQIESNKITKKLKLGEDTKETKWSGKVLTLETVAARNKHEATELNKIPMGSVGARMMVTFGDGKSPDPDAVRMVLEGARLSLLNIIKDARALRRHAKSEYAKAQRAMHMGHKNFRRKAKNGKDDRIFTSEGVDPSLLYRSINRNDKLVYDPKCGFDIEQLQQLLPEEMNAYDRWNEMHEAYEASTSAEDIDRDKNTTRKGQAAWMGSRLDERAAQFDVRTHKMKKGWYLDFSEVRQQGSFLPRRRGRKPTAEKEWEAQNHKQGGWEALAVNSVKFLHWIGFNPTSDLPPPNEEVTHALAFLGYDIIGKIVEKAIVLRVLAEQKKRQDGGNDRVPTELEPGEQLDSEDVKRALRDATVLPTSLFSAESTARPAAQLYFGPGFENRLEMEMDELVQRSQKWKDCSEDELKIRRREDQLFEELASNPVLTSDLNPSTRHKL